MSESQKQLIEDLKGSGATTTAATDTEKKTPVISVFDYMDESVLARVGCAVSEDIDSRLFDHTPQAIQRQILALFAEVVRQYESRFGPIGSEIIVPQRLKEEII